MNFPTVSIVIPTFNEEKNISKCLDSVFNQKYPVKKIEVIVVDNYSTDNTIKIVKKYKTKIILNKIRHGEVSKMIGFRAAKSEFAMYLDADIELRGRNWLKQMVKPLLNDSTVIGSFTKYYSKNNSTSIEKFLNLDPLQRDGIYQYFSPSPEDLIIDRKNGYFVCEYQLNKIPPAGLCLYRKNTLLKLVEKYEMFLELDFLVILTSKGFNRFAYVPLAGLYHKHVNSFLHLLQKRKYNLEKVYLGRSVRLYKWFDLKTVRGFLKLLLWVIYANLFIPSFFLGLYKSIKNRQWVGFYEPFVNLVLTDYLIFLFIINNNGRRLITHNNENN